MTIEFLNKGFQTETGVGVFLYLGFELGSSPFIMSFFRVRLLLVFSAEMYLFSTKDWNTGLSFIFSSPSLKVISSDYR